MALIKTKYCSFCKVRHPEDDFTQGQWVCKYGRAQQGKEMARKNTERPQDPNYKKRCNTCQKLKLARKSYGIDLSRPDGYFGKCKDCQEIDKQRVGKIWEIGGQLVINFREKLIKTVLKTLKDSKRSITRQLVEDFLHEGGPVSFSGREWQIQILNDMRPNVVSRKPSQKGLTWILEHFVMALLIRYAFKPYRYVDHTGQERSRFIEAIYSFETSSKASKWSKVRLKKIKDDNPHIRDALKIGETDSALLMKIGRTALHLIGRATVSSVLTISGDIVVIDEKDRDADPSVSTQIGSRTLESVFMNTEATKGITRETSTPEVSGAGISLQYEDSDQAEWEIFCVECDSWQDMTYPESVGNFYDKGEDPLRDDDGYELTPFWRCKQCGKPIDWKTIGIWKPEDPDYYENCRWVVKKPQNYNAETGRGIGGYQVPFAGPQRSAAFFLSERDNPEHDIVYLYNHMLGLPYDDISKTLVPDNFHSHPEFSWGYSARERYVLGCDHHPSQGGFIVICRQVYGSISSAKPEGKWVVVYLEHVRSNRELWDDTENVQNIDTIVKGRLHQLITEWNISLAVVDLEPDTNEVEKLINEFGFSKQVWANKSSGTSKESFTWVETETVDNEERVVCKMIENKVAAIDFYFNKIRFGDILFLEKEKYPNPKLWQKFVDSHTNLYKSEITKSSTGGNAIVEKLAAQNIREVYKKRVSSIEDHWVMAGKFCAQGIRLIDKIGFNSEHIAPPSVRGMARIPGQ